MMIQTHLIICKDWADIKDKAKSLEHIIRKCDPPTPAMPLMATGATVPGLYSHVAHLVLSMGHACNTDIDTSFATLIIGSAMTMCSKLLRTPTTASASVAICLISLKVGFEIVVVLSTVLLNVPL